MQVLHQITKFVIVGVSNTLVDLAVLNLLIFLTGIASGAGFSFFKAVSFLFAVTNSYFWNRRWTFRSDKQVFTQFFVVSTIGLLLNVGTASFFVNILGPQFGLSETIWANVGAVGGTLVVMTWNFLGYKFVVFRK
mgnify:FL=1